MVNSANAQLALFDWFSSSGKDLKLSGHVVTPENIPVLGATTCNKDGGYKSVINNNPKYDICNLLSCTKHEEDVHIPNYKKSAPNLCKNGKDGELLQYTSTEAEIKHERPAYIKSDQCYDDLIKTYQEQGDDKYVRILDKLKDDSIKAFENNTGKPLYEK